MCLIGAAMALPVLGGNRVRVGPLIAAGYIEARSPEGHGISHWKDQTSEGWVLRVGDVHWVIALPF